MCAAACSRRPSATAPSARVHNRSRRPTRSSAREPIRHTRHGIDVAARNARFALTLVRSVLCVLCVRVRARVHARSCMLPRWQVRVCVRARTLVRSAMFVCLCVCVYARTHVHAPRQQVHVACAFHACARTCAPRRDGWARHWTDILLVLGPGDFVATNGRSQQPACSSAPLISFRTS